MIVRLMGEGQYRVDDGLLAGLNELDDEGIAAVEGGDEDRLRSLLEQMSARVRSGGEPLDDGDLSPSDLIIPPSDLSLEEAKELFSGDGLIPDLPAE
ncbi:MAG: hypothetical protein H0V84_01295 [Actinobacteria bacterium]|nr:hypothetical protein [Actinomycetota bacterium]